MIHHREVNVKVDCEPLATLLLCDGRLDALGAPDQVEDLVKHQQRFTRRRSVHAVEGLRQGLVKDQAAALIGELQPEAHHLQGRPPGEQRRHVEDVVTRRGALVQLQQSLLHCRNLPHSAPWWSGGAVQGDVHAEGPRVQGLPVQNQFGSSQQGALEAAHVEPDPPWRRISRT